MTLKQLAYLSLFWFLPSCGNSAPKEKMTRQEKSTQASPARNKKPASPESKEDKDPTAISHKKRFSGYEFEFGYAKYDPESFENPGYLRVLRDGKVLFADQFEGEGDVSVKSLGTHSLSGKKLVFTLNYGTAACDYTQSTYYYSIDADNRVKFLKKCYASCGGDGYACHVFKHIFPEDSLGKPNTILFTEGFVYNEHDEEDKIDTLQISFSKNTFKTKRLTNNLEEE